MSGSEADEDANSPPERLPSDNVQLGFLLIVLLIGLPSNCLIFRRILRLHKASHKDSVKTGFLLLNLNLAISDIMLLLLYALPKLLWNLTYEWRGTDGMCKTHKYLSMASYYLSSNIIVCIAIDRLKNVLGASKIRRGSTSSIRVLIIAAWLLAFLWSSPQLLVFQTVDVLADSEGSWIQCSDVWTINSFHKVGAPPTAPEWLLQPSMRAAYELAHLLLVFWGPLAALSICYIIIAIRLARYSMGGPQTEHRLSCEPTDGNYLADSDSRKSSLLVLKKSRGPWTFESIIAVLRKRRQSSMVPQNIVDCRLISMHAYFLNDLQILITIVNPMLYAIVQ
ncbi:hypothetical protein PRIPAC_81470 [Pristionchus pacificus]|uniref:G protein-coupled receptor n=1 Tax=Pristionchus pacificus TaxID=54126 RepID=A0A2A6CJM0_PRIPA|nr:hypothetical protein PRIPAC_81470 [Pristionchus pacificus]|eukprot:PDM78243.1 G protein-coupled receptor [Pristionchus pacificus]